MPSYTDFEPIIRSGSYFYKDNMTADYTMGIGFGSVGHAGVYVNLPELANLRYVLFTKVDANS